jgi:hypothetical protein
MMQYIWVVPRKIPGQENGDTKSDDVSISLIKLGKISYRFKNQGRFGNRVAITKKLRKESCDKVEGL